MLLGFHEIGEKANGRLAEVVAPHQGTDKSRGRDAMLLLKS